MAELAAAGAGNKEIARTLHVGPQQVKNTLSTVYRLLDLPADCNKRVALARLLLARQARHEED